MGLAWNLAFIIDVDETAFVHGNSLPFEVKVLSVWLPSYGNENVVSFNRRLLALALNLNFYVVTFVLPTEYFCPHHEFYALFLQDFLKGLRSLKIRCWSDPIEEFNNGDLGS